MPAEFPRNHAVRRVLQPLLCFLILLSGWSGNAAAGPLRRIDQIMEAAAGNTAAKGTPGGQEPARSGLRRHHPRLPSFPPGPPLAMPSWSAAYVRDGVSYPLTVVGTDPALGQTTIIPTVIFAYRLQLADGSIFDASSDLIDGTTPVQGVLDSPIFKPVPWNIGGISLGTTQWGDAVMRANFWSRKSDRGAGYHVLLGTPTVIPVVVDVPAAYGRSGPDPKSGALEAFIDADWTLDLTVQVTNAYGIPPTTLPIHLLSQVIGGAYGYELFSGYHDFQSVTSSGSTVAAPFILSAYLSKAREIPDGRVQGENTGVLAHEIAEWLMDPALSNHAAPWQNPAEPRVCNNPLLEVGDPLEITAPGVQMGGYRFPDVALLPWFTGSPFPETANHRYSLFGTLTSPSAICPKWSEFGELAFSITGADTTILSGINNRQQVVGYFTVGNAVGSFIINNVDTTAGTLGTINGVTFPGPLATYAQGINDAGNVVGIYLDSQQQVHGFLSQGETYLSIDFPGAVATEALGINNHGDIVGDYTDSAGRVHGFVRIEGHFFNVDAPFASALSINGINDSRSVVGTYSSGSSTAAFSGPLWDLRPFSYPQVSPLDAVDYPITWSTQANGLNNSSEIVGGFAETGSPFAAYVANEGTFDPVAMGPADFDGSMTTQATGVNDAGVVVGTYTDSTGTYAAVLAPGSAFGLPYQRLTIAPP